MKPLLEQYSKYVHQIYGQKSGVLKWSGDKELPLYLRESYDLYETEISTKKAILAVDKREEEQPPAKLQNQLKQIRQRTNYQVIYLRSSISSHNRNRLIAHHIPFVIPGRQLHVPMFGMDFRERFGVEKPVRSGMSPSAQAFLLYCISRKLSGPINPGEIAERIGYSPMTMTRIFAELQRLGIGEHNVQRKNRQIRFLTTFKELWLQSLSYMKSPVKKRYYVEAGSVSMNLPLAGLSALARWTMIAEPPVTIHSCSVDLWKNLKETAKIVPVPDQNVIQVEVWSYRPELLAENGFVDRRSLYLSLRHDNDERVTASLEEMMQEMSW